MEIYFVIFGGFWILLLLYALRAACFKGHMGILNELPFVFVGLALMTEATLKDSTARIWSLFILASLFLYCITLWRTCEESAGVRLVTVGRVVKNPVKRILLGGLGLFGVALPFYAQFKTALEICAFVAFCISLGIYMVFTESRDLELTEEGVLFPGGFMEYEEIKSYEWKDDKLKLHFGKDFFSLAPKTPFEWDIPPDTKDILQQLLTRLLGEPKKAESTK